ncbi:hypothetical protein GCM10009592_26450 [Brachybacterium rhamnosum]|uniref:Phage tail protein n=1 Tax=Brachybacterium rhamnosum TaxID=173361 RepID=A0ABW4Q1L7_9MICO
MTWSAYLGRTMTGEVGPKLDVTSGTLNMALNDHDDLTLVIARDSLDGVEPDFWRVRAGALVITYTDAHDVERPVTVCAVSDPPAENRAAGTVTLKGKGPGWLFERRVLLDKEYPVATAGDARKATIRFHGDTFPSIIGEVLRLGMAKRNGYLPLVTPPRETGKRVRTYAGWNFANNEVWKRVKEMTEVINGPDVAFRPEWANEQRTAFRWRLTVGTEAQPTLPQERTVLWDATSVDSSVSSMTVTSDATGIAHRVYTTGAGEGAAIAVAVAEVAELSEYMPFVEVVTSDADAEQDDASGSSALLKSKAEARLATEALDQVSLTVNADSSDEPIGTWWCGELAVVNAEGWLDVPDGEHLLRVIAAKYTYGSDVVALECQADALGEELAW